MDTRYPNLMAYITNRNALTGAADWCGQLRVDEAEASTGKFSEVAAELAQAKADYAAAQKARGLNPYPYNRDMGLFLGLAIRGSGEPGHGYYMANGVLSHYRLGVAERAVAAMIAEGRTLAIVTARAKADGKPIRFARFRGEQIKIAGNTVEVANGKYSGRLSSNWSVESCLEAVARALQSGQPYRV